MDSLFPSVVASWRHHGNVLSFTGLARVEGLRFRV